MVDRIYIMNSNADNISPGPVDKIGISIGKSLQIDFKTAPSF
jgi:hypothetical protein